MKVSTRDDGVVFAVKVVPGASRSRIAGSYGDGVRVTVTAPPEAGAANSAAVALIANALGVPTASIRIVRGLSTPHKEIQVSGLSPDDVRRRLG